MAFWFAPTWILSLIWWAWSAVGWVKDLLENHERGAFLYHLLKWFIKFIFPDIDPSYLKPLDPSSKASKVVTEEGETILTHTQRQEVHRRSFAKTRKTFRTIAFATGGLMILWTVLWVIAFFYHMLYASGTIRDKSHNFVEEKKKFFAECTANKVWDKPNSPKLEPCNQARDVVNNRVAYPFWSEWWQDVCDMQCTVGFFSLSDVTKNLTRVSTNGWINFMLNGFTFVATIAVLAFVIDYTDPPIADQPPSSNDSKGNPNKEETEKAASAAANPPPKQEVTVAAEDRKKK